MADINIQIAKANKLRHEWSVNDAKRDSGVVAADVACVNDIKYRIAKDIAEQENQLLDIYYPKDYEDKNKQFKYPVIVSVHGGGWFYGDKELYSLYTKYLASKGFAVVNFNYRRAPEHKYPAAFEDVCYVMDFIAQNADKYKLDMKRLYMVGDSAGAQLVSQYSVFATSDIYRKMFNELDNIQSPVPDKVALNCGIYKIDLDADKQMMDWYINADETEQMKKTLIDVLEYINEDFPASYVMTSVNDPLLPRTKAILDKFEEMHVEHIYCEYGQKDENDAHVFHLNLNSLDGIKCNAEEIEFFLND